MEPQPTNSFRPFSQSYGCLYSCSSLTPSSDTSSCLANGVLPGVLPLGTAAAVLVRGVQDPGVVITGLVVETTALVLDRLPLLTQRVEVRLLLLRDRAEVQDFGLVWRRAV